MSRQSHILTEEGFHLLLNHCRRNNSERNVTGLLVSYRGIFIQYIEGDPAIVDALFEKIKKDPRHHEVVELDSGLQERRQFSNWSMAFKKLDDEGAKKMLGYKEFSKEEIFMGGREETNHHATALLNSFINNL